ncbi:MAG TPA: response regulator [Geothrix sp.]|uniref:response regulator n=1 Tax=Geothrix mesophila TaxID=2922723 RepID=UPI001FAC6296|nr:response regulator [Geothrix sp. SG198]HJV37743.1 response regulator [Geothrix sp.]
MGLRLLLVDSDRSFLKEHKVSLEAAFDLEVASSPDGVVERLERGGFAAALICVEVADNKGYALCSTLRRQPALAALKIALISAKATEEEYRRHQSLKGRADVYLRKPIAPSALVAALSPLVPARAVDPDNPLGDLADVEGGDDWLDNLRGAMAAPTPAPKSVPAPSPEPPPAPPVPAAAKQSRSTRPPDTTRAHLLEEQVVALREELRVRDQQLREAEDYLHERIGAATLNLDEIAARDRDLAAARQEAEDARTTSDRLQKDLAALKSAMQVQEREQAELKARLKQAEAELAASVAGAQEREQELQSSQEALQQREKEALRLTSQVAGLRQQLDEALVQHDGERLELMNGMDQKEAELARLKQELVEQREAHAVLEREKQAAYGQLSEHRDRLRNLDTLLREVQDHLRRGSDLAKG